MAIARWSIKSGASRMEVTHDFDIIFSVVTPVEFWCEDYKFDWGGLF